MVVQPTGTVTLLFTDVEGSTLLLERLGAERFAEALALHRRVLREAFARHGGYEVDEEGDAFRERFWSAASVLQGVGGIVLCVKQVLSKGTHDDRANDDVGY